MIDTPVPASFLLLVILLLPFIGAMIASGLPRHARTSAAVLSWIIALISVGCLAVLWPRFQDGEVLITGGDESLRLVPDRIMN